MCCVHACISKCEYVELKGEMRIKHALLLCQLDAVVTQISVGSYQAFPQSVILQLLNLKTGLKSMPTIPDLILKPLW